MLEVIDHGPIRELQIAHPPVNALRPQVLATLREALEAAPAAGARAVVVSGAPGFFSAGLDVPFMLEGGEAVAVATFEELFALRTALVVSEVPVAAAITGHSPAGGAVLAICCDYRVMAEGKYKIGLNEVQVGLPVSPILQANLRRVVGTRNAERMCVEGRLLSPETAYEIGLVDRLAPLEEVVPTALGWCEKLLAAPTHAMLRTRAIARADLVELYADSERLGPEEFIEAWSNEGTQATMRALVARLKDKR
jgi:enoyl-CoA hydratase/carnithine racemase